jgi:sec-independent protein translocase protein TatA
MNFFGMGAWEIGVILIVALIIFGPGKLPEVMGQVGKAVRDFRRLTTDLTGEFERSTGINDIKKTLQNEITGVKNEVTGVGTSIHNEVKSTASAATSTSKSSTTTSSTTPSFKPATPAVTAGSSASTSSKATATPSVATKKDPLADLVAFDEVVPVESNGSSDSPSMSTNSSNGETSTNGAAVPADALSRARLRRQQAGYNRPPASVG